MLSQKLRAALAVGAGVVALVGSSVNAQAATADPLTPAQRVVPDTPAAKAAAAARAAANASMVAARSLATAGAPQYVRFAAEHSGKCLTVAGGSVANGAKAVQSVCLPDDDNQVFELLPVGSSHFVLRGKRSGRCLTSGKEVDWKVGQQWCNGDASQEWRIVKAGAADGIQRYQLRLTKELEFCSTIAGAGQNDGAATFIGFCGDVSAARWSMETVES
ncbi:RICIN domain-containing protein [Streptomyces sp. NPDC001941]|uniref:RICIN domain-containing protein n=1 Tax=Streptomyces sp. NPDC001941 TaxID=3154659 RepID=UPI00331F1322